MARRSRRSTQRSRNRARNRARAQRAAKKRVSARKAAGRKPSGANQAANRAAATARAQAAAKRRQQAAETSRKAAVDRAIKAAEAKKTAEAKARQTAPKQTFDKAVSNIQKNQSFGPVADGATYARNITNYNMKFGKTPEIRAKAYEQSLDKKSFKGLSDGQTFGVGPVASGDAYARGLNTDNKNVENRLRQIRNLGSTLTGGLIPSVRKLTDKEIADRRIKNAEFRRNNLMGRGGGSGGGVSRIQQQAAATQMQPEIAPTIGTPEEELLPSQTAPQGDLTRIQSQAYNTQLTSSLAGMFGGQGSVGYTPQGDQALSPTLRAGRSRGRRRVRMFGARRRRGGSGDQFSRAGDRIAKLTNINI